MAYYEDSHFESFQKLSDVTNYYMESEFEQFRNQKDTKIYNLEFYFPVLVVEGDLLEAKPTQKSVKLRKSKHVLFHKDTITKNTSNEYCIDVVTENGFKNLLNTIDNEMKRIAHIIGRKNGVIASAMEQMARCKEENESFEIRW